MAYKRQTVTRAPRRKLIWARQPAIDFSISVASPQTTQIDLLANFEAAYGAQLIGCTIMRIRGQYSFSSSTATTAVTAVLPVVVGIMVTNGTVPLGTVSGPIAAPYEDWMYYDSVYRNEGSEPVGGFPNVLRRDFDVKSMRKLDELQQRLIMSFQGHPGTPALNGNLTISTLVALP